MKDLQALPAEVKKDLAAALRAKFIPRKIEWEPSPKQLQALLAASEALETLYGGAAFGGKSYFISHQAVQDCLDLPGAHVAIVRRTLPMLKQTHLITLKPLLQDIAVFNATDFTWTFPNQSILRFISLPHEGDEQQYKSVQFDRLYFDELTEFTEEQYTYMLTRLRSKNGHRVCALSASNPEGVHFLWVKERFITPTEKELGERANPEPYEIWNPYLPDTGEEGPARAYVPATVYDNPKGLAANPGYIKQLEAMPDARKRAALLHGDWEAMTQVEGALWNLDTIDAHRVRDIPDDLERIVVAVDPAVSLSKTSDYTGIVVAGCKGPRDDRDYYVLGDFTLKAEPLDWGRAAVLAWWHCDAGYIIGESDNGGLTIRDTIITAARQLLAEGLIDYLPDVVLERARDAGNKAIRARPIAAIYSTGRVHHVIKTASDPLTGLKPLEDQLITWTPEHKKSPDRLDALVWAMKHLAKAGNGVSGAI